MIAVPRNSGSLNNIILSCLCIFLVVLLTLSSIKSQIPHYRGINNPHFDFRFGACSEMSNIANRKSGSSNLICSKKSVPLSRKGLMVMYTLLLLE